MLFDRVKSLDKILEAAEKKGLKRQLGWFQLTMMGIAAIIGMGIFVLTSQAIHKAGPSMLISLVITSAVCGITALIYSEISSMIPVSGSAYTYSYGVLGEFIAWFVGWALILEYAIAAGGVAVGWSGYVNALLVKADLALPLALTAGPGDVIGDTGTKGTFNLLAFALALLVTWLLVLGTSKSAKVTAVLVIFKIAALALFVVLTVPNADLAHFTPMFPNGWGTPLSGTGVLGAAALIFFAFVGFDAVSTATEETINPNRNIPIGLIASLSICAIFYMLIGYGAIGALGGQPGGELATSKHALSFVLDSVGHPNAGSFVAMAASLSMPAVVLMMIYGQTRILFAMSRDGLMPSAFSKVHPRYQTPHVVTIITGLFVAFFAAIYPTATLAEISNTGTLAAFATVAIGVMVLRIKQPNRPRAFRTPMIWVLGPLTVIGCVVLFLSLGWDPTIKYFCIWSATGIAIYFLFARRHSLIGKELAAEKQLEA